MLGYISPEKAELKIKEYEIYSGYYCGICKSIGRRYGQIPRLALSYDSVFLALLFSSAYDVKESATFERCIVHPLKKRTIIGENIAIDYAADMFLILMYFKLKDDELDNNSFKSKFGLYFGNETFKKLEKLYPSKIEYVKFQLEELHKLEKEKCSSIDVVAEPFSKLSQAIFTIENDDVSPFVYVKGRDKILKSIGYYLGKWLYLIDAIDDIEADIEKSNYNPLLLKFEFDNTKESPSEFRIRIKERMEFNLLSYLSEISKAYDLLDSKKNNGILENIIYLGLLKKTENLLLKGSIDSNGQSI